MKARLPKGMRDFLPIEVRRRNYIFDTIRSVFETYGYAPIETPAMEALETLQGKYGDEGDQLLFKILNNGDFLDRIDPKILEQKDSDSISSSISKRGLKYDLTVPFSRFVVMHQNEVQFPFKRYQIQPVWRADRPQKGRYREFYQCDVDVIGSNSLIYEAELLNIYIEVFKRLDLSVKIRISNRKILAGIATYAGVEDQLTSMTIAIDKLDKVGLSEVQEELKNNSFDTESIEKITNVLQTSTLDEVADLLSSTTNGIRGVEEIKKIREYLAISDTSPQVQFDVTLARGLNYYTGFICEVVSTETKMGSIGGGGRYDDLTAVFGLKNVSGVGISFGAERIYDIMLELDKFPKGLNERIKAFFISFDEESLRYNFDIVQELRSKGVPVDIYPEAVKIGKQMKYAHQNNYNHVVLVGSDERSKKVYLLRNMKSGEERSLTREELTTFLLTNET